MSEHKHVKSIDGQPKPADIFQPYLQGVELFEDMDSVFLEARQFAAGQHPSPNIPEANQGHRGVAIVTPVGCRSLASQRDKQRRIQTLKGIMLSFFCEL